MVRRQAVRKMVFNLKSKIENPKLVGIIALVFTFAVGGAVVEAQQPKKMPRIGYLSNVDPATESIRSEAIQLALRERGYIEGQTIAIEYRYAEGKIDRFPELAAELVRLKVDIIVVAGGGDPPIQAAKNATKTIPIVMMGAASDPVEAGFIESLARPGGNVTGLSALTRELDSKRLELLKEAVPKLARVAVLYYPIPSSVHRVKEDLPVAARSLGLAIQPWEVRGADDFDKVFSGMGKQRLNGLYVLGSPLTNTNRKRIADFVLKSRLPSIYPSREFVDAGGLMAYGADLADSYTLAATYVDRILKGAKPAELPVQQPTKFEMVINLKTAKQMGVTIPPNMLARADRVIK